MIRFTIAAAVATLCFCRSSLGFVPSSGRPNLSSVPQDRTLVRYSDVVLEEQKEELKSRLPPVDRQQMSKLSFEFRELLEAMLYTPQEMSSITNPRLRVIFEGVAASYYEPAVYRAFEVLYEDYMPLRVAGRIIHGKLQKVMDNSKEYQRDQLQAVVSKTGFPIDRVGRAWDTFVRIAGGRELVIEKVETLVCRGQESGVLPKDPKASLSVMNPNDQDGLTFEELVDGILALESNVDGEKLEQLLQNSGIEDVSHMSGMDARHQKYSDRYDEMLVKFGEWKAFIPSGEGRRLDILRGCFVGSENRRVVEALRVIYSDYSALRMSGDWIFQVVSTLMNGTMRRRQQKDNR